MRVTLDKYLPSEAYADLSRKESAHWPDTDLRDRALDTARELGAQRVTVYAFPDIDPDAKHGNRLECYPVFHG